MGRRFQLIIKTPAEYWNANNPNNREGRLFVYHYQWLWGAFAVWRMGNLITGLKLKIAHQKERRENFPLTYTDIIQESLDWVNHKNLMSQNHCRGYFNDNQSEITSELLKDSWIKGLTFKEFLDKLDNNNGVLFIEITKMNKIRYAFYNPTNNEGSQHNKLLSYSEYLKDYSKDEKDFRAVNSMPYSKELDESIKEFKLAAVLKKFPILKEFPEVKKQ
jgi:hypothetical protein